MGRRAPTNPSVPRPTPRRSRTTATRRTRPSPGLGSAAHPSGSKAGRPTATTARSYGSRGEWDYVTAHGIYSVRAGVG